MTVSAGKRLQHRCGLGSRCLRPIVIAQAAGLAFAVGGLIACSSATPDTNTSPRSGTVGAPASSPLSTPTASGDAGSALSTTEDIATPRPEDVLAKTRAAVDSSTSSHVSGTVLDGGTPVTIDVAGRTDATSARGSLRSADANLEFIVVGGQTYLRGDSKFWAQARVPADRASQLASSKKWVKASTAEATSFVRLANPKALLSEFLDASGLGGQSQQIEGGTIDGADCWTIKSRSEENAARLDVVQSSFVPTRLVITKDQSLTFDQWNEVPDPTAPPASQIITG